MPSGSELATEQQPKRKPASLSIVGQERPYTALRGDSPMTAPLTWERDKNDTTPRALRSLSKIIDGGLCHRCGSCVGI